MKELSIEEKAKAYDMAIEELRGLLECIHEDKCDIMEEDIIKIFPELKESEDEKIRACIGMCLTDIDEQRFADFNTNLKECRAWLEKQGEQKPAFDIDIPFGAKDSELMGASYYIPKGFHAEIEGNHVVIKKGEQKPQGKTALEAINKEKVDNANKVEPKQEKLTKFEKAVKQVMEEAIECGDTHNLKADADMLLSLVQKSTWKDEISIAVNNPEAYKIGFADGEAHAKEEQWKPSDEQLKMLDEVIDVLHRMQLFGGSSALIFLKHDLEKLRGEQR